MTSGNHGDVGTIAGPLDIRIVRVVADFVSEKLMNAASRAIAFKRAWS